MRLEFLTRQRLFQITYTGYSKQEPGVTHDGSATSVSSDVLEKIIVGLKPDYDYSFSVNAKYDDPGLSEDSTAVYTVATNGQYNRYLFFNICWLFLAVGSNFAEKKLQEQVQM